MLPALDAPETAFAILRDVLAAHAYTSEEMCRRLGVEDVHAVRLGEPRPDAAEPRDGFDLLVRLFVERGEVDGATLDAAVGVELTAVLRMLGLVTGTATLRATVYLYPVAEVWLISDLDLAESPPADFVYPGLSSSVRVFLAAFPDVRGQRVLELCSGTGVAALLAMRRGAREAVAVDITARSTHFAAFNARLNDLTIRAVQGDLYAPVADDRFDVILAHPPYVPSLKTRAIFRDGGADGEEISRAVIAGAVSHLTDTGVLLCTSSLTDRRSGSALERVHALLGEAAGQTDLLLLHVSDLLPDSAFLTQLFTARPDEISEVMASWRAFRTLDITKIRLCTTVLRRHAGQRPSVRAAVSCDRRTQWPQVEWMFAAQELPWHIAEDPASWRLARPRLNASALLEQHYRFVPGHADRFVPEQGKLGVDYPAVLSVRMNGADAVLLGALDGSQTFDDLWHEYRSAGTIPEAITPEEFIRSMLPLLVSGVLETDRLPIPPLP